MSTFLKINILQFDIQWLDPQENISLIEDHLRSLKEQVDLVVLPEMYLSGFCMDASKSAIREDGNEINQLIALARGFEVTLIGSLAIEENQRYFNRVLLISKDGIMGRYDKRRLYSPSGENEAFSTKYEVNLIDFKGWKILPQVCYDLRFPENIRPLSSPDLLIYMANWPAPRIYHWDILLKARAIENQCFTIGCNRIGVDGNDWEYPGHSVVIKPNGELIEASRESSSHIFEISKSTILSYRSKYRFLEDK